MLTKKEKKKRIILIGVIALILLVTMFIFLYIKTDMFKSSRVLFKKYFSKNIENVEDYLAAYKETDYEVMKSQNKCRLNNNVKFNYVENLGTTDEKMDNVINQLELNAVGEIDRNNNYTYQDIKLVKNGNKLAEVEYGQTDIIDAIRFTDLFERYIAVNNTNTKDMFEKIGIKEKYYFDFDGIQLSNQEKDILKNKYLLLIFKSIDKNKFTKKKNDIIEIDEKNVYVNRYDVTMTIEEINDIYLKVLEQLKDEEIILSKLENFGDWKEKYMSYIDNKIIEINKNNIGQEEVNIAVYENSKKVVRTVIKDEESEMKLDWLNQNEERYVEFSIEKHENIDAVKIRKTNNSQIIEYNKIENEKESNVVFKQFDKTENEGGNEDIEIIFEKNDEKLEIKINQTIEVIEELKKETNPQKRNYVLLNDLNEEKLEELKKLVENKVKVEYEKIKQEVPQEQIEKILKLVGLMGNISQIEEKGISETEKNRYNSQYEMLKAEEIDGKRILNMLDAIKDNIFKYEVVSSNVLKINVERNKSDEEIVKRLKEFFEKNSNKNYNVDIEYDDSTGLVNNIILTIVTKK